jgi:hypothetical protein
MFCFISPLIGVSLRHTTLNDWSENAITFWATVGLFSSAITLGVSTSQKKRLPQHAVPTIVFCLTTVSLGHPMTGILMVLPVFLVTAFIWSRRPVILNKVELVTIVIALCAYVTIQCFVAIDVFTEFLAQTQFGDLPRESRYTHGGLVSLIIQFVSRQTGVIGSTELGFTGLSLFLYMIGKDMPLLAKRVKFLLLCNTAVLLSSELSRVYGVSMVLAGERFSFSEWALILNLVVLGQIALTGRIRERLSAVRGPLKALQLMSLMPLVALPVSVTISSLRSATPKWQDTAERTPNSFAVQDQVMSGHFAYFSEAISRELTRDTSKSLGPIQAQSVGVSTLNNYSRLRSSQTLVRPRSLFENGIRENVCIDRWVAGFIQLDIVVGERFCDEGWEKTSFVETNHRKFWIHDVFREVQVINEPCPLLQEDCRENWKAKANFSETSVGSSEYFYRCVTTCVARFRLRGDFLNVLAPINFDSGISVVNQNGDSLGTSNFHGLLLVEIPSGSSSHVSGTILFEPDLRTYLRAGANLLLTVMLVVSAALTIPKSRKFFSRP